jgi:hypothetical protein
MDHLNREQAHDARLSQSRGRRVRGVEAELDLAL